MSEGTTVPRSADTPTWLREAADALMRTARTYFVPAEDAWLVEVEGDLGLELWALAPMEWQARLELRRKIQTHFAQADAALHAAAAASVPDHEPCLVCGGVALCATATFYPEGLVCTACQAVVWAAAGEVAEAVHPREPR